jgi:hypothetical protein
MEIIVGLVIFFAVWAIIIWRLRVVQHRIDRWVDAAYTKPNHEKFSGYWYWPKSPDI